MIFQSDNLIMVCAFYFFFMVVCVRFIKINILIYVSFENYLGVPKSSVYISNRILLIPCNYGSTVKSKEKKTRHVEKPENIL